MLEPTDLTARAISELRTRFGTEAAVTGRAPGRVNLIGEHTDYNAGLVLPVALPHATYAAAAPRTDGVIRITSAQEPEPFTGHVDELGPEIEGWAAYVAGVLWTLREAGLVSGGLDMHLESSVPLGAGLSSSASVECATAVAALGAAGRTLDADLQRAIVDAGIRAETEVADAPTGGMDQSVAVFAEAGGALLIDFDSGEHHSVPLALGERTILVTDTRVKHQLTDGGYASRRAQCEKAAADLGLSSLREADLEQVETLGDEVVRRRARHIVTETARVEPTVTALGEGDWASISELFAASHASMRDDFEISVVELDLAVSTAVEAGADGARMTGGGFGGSIVSILPSEAVETVTAAIDRAFAEAGHNPPGHLIATPSAGASYTAC
ncbi:galactokinase [Nocardioides luteus]|uniref:Galactokinase n=1 Tax=Nocardioides luteus TaxID=1844 RepID=A0ABQ5T0K9_9ACTN|nr:galactokinase [Nocardioides luteus]MDR7310963.1 galactokinase [Nocardioides luteus]GGR39476.1 galactokinase [Nocardioides luteus]GLJ69257.1 galactokinase [Nocardioides luteus]